MVTYYAQLLFMTLDGKNESLTQWIFHVHLFMFVCSYYHFQLKKESASSPMPVHVEILSV